MQKRLFPLLSWFAWSLLTWLALGVAVFSLVDDLREYPQIPSWRWWLGLTMPSAAVLCGWRALRAGNALGRLARVIFWMFTVAGIALVAALLQGQCEVYSKHLSDDRQMLMTSLLLPFLALAFAGVREWRAGGFKSLRFGWLLDIPGGIACLLVLSAVVFFARQKTVVEPLRLRAEQRWAQIGRPMPEFAAKNIRRVDENASLRELTADLKPFGVFTFYKSQEIAGNSLKNLPELAGLVTLMSDARDIKGDTITESLKVSDTAKASLWLDIHAGDLERLYQGILRRDPPVWSYNPEDGFHTGVPDYLAARQLAQVICADAFHRLAHGDRQGASDAAAAVLRMTQKMGEQPNLVSNMIHVAIEALFSPVIARLPAQPDDMQQLAAEVTATRRQFADTEQTEAWKLMHTFEATSESMDVLQTAMGRDDHWILPVIHPLPEWIGGRAWPLYSRAFARIDCSKAWLYQADLVRISQRAPELADSDLGAAEMDASEIAHLSPFVPSGSRAWLRLNCALLLHEQALIIRHARAQMQAGKNGGLGEMQSVVIPGSKWTVTGDATTGAIALKLTPRPAWTIDSPVAPPEFFLLPFDGSKSWQFRPAPPALSER